MSFPTDFSGAMPFAPMAGMQEMGAYGPSPSMFHGGPHGPGYAQPPHDMDGKGGDSKGGDGKGKDGERMQSELQRVRFRAQFSKTEMCRYYRSGCRNALSCPYAHGEHELTTRPDLSKTSLCRAWSKNQCPLNKEDCRFAHGTSDLRATPLYEKIAICKAFTHGRCKLGSSCRFAHSAEELHMDQMAAGGKGTMGAGMPAFSGKGPAGPMGHPGGMPFGQNPMGAMPSGHYGEGQNHSDFMPYMMPNMMSMPPVPYMMQGPPMPTGPSIAPAPPPPPVTATSGGATAEPKKDMQLMVKCKQGGSVKFKIKAAMPLRKLMDAFCARKSLQRADVRFFVNDKEISPEDTATKLGLVDDATIQAELNKVD